MKVQFNGFDIEGTPVEVFALITECSAKKVANEVGIANVPHFDEPKQIKKEPNIHECLREQEQKPEEAEYDEPEFDFEDDDPIHRPRKKIFVERADGNGGIVTDAFDSIEDLLRRKHFVRSKIYPYWKMDAEARVNAIARNLIAHYDSV